MPSIRVGQFHDQQYVLRDFISIVQITNMCTMSYQFDQFLCYFEDDWNGLTLLMCEKTLNGCLPPQPR